MFKTGAKESNSSRSLSHFFYLHCMIESSNLIWNSAMGIGEAPYSRCRDKRALTNGNEKVMCEVLKH